MTTSDPVAERLLDELIASAGRRKRLLAVECDDALLEIAPQLRSDPGRRRRLLELLRDLRDEHRIEWSVALDRTVRPELPAFITIVPNSDNEQVSPPAPRGVWRPELEWAYDLRLTPSEYEALAIVNAYRRDRSPSAPVIPHRERSLLLFGDEKRLDRIVRSRLGDPGRLALDLIDCYWAPPPIAWTGKGTGLVGVVSENAASWHTLRATCSDDIGWIAYGAGAAFVQSIAGLAGFGIERLLYIGDLDADGIAIPQRAAVVAERFGVPAPEPHTQHWELLVTLAEQHGQQTTPIPAEVAADLCRWFGPSSLATEVKSILEAGVRVPQESLTAERLRAGPQIGSR